ncbi:MAG: ATP-binding cassette domain-containing protein [Erysipelotrichaceae bacterium]|nr:ATP-binding cassette domain-containing protein [Erysipelotrichaceae bacterium]
MLQIKDICKEYRTGPLVQKALDHVSLNLRDNEFVAILGPSGSGKTTLLNIIGGLDRYDSGDLVINGISTRKYKDRDWDSYRNHTIGFVFQSYNLIAHQTVLSNVELALTIGGISRNERRQRAADALTKVGLGDQLHKKPSQMSGGQMQRVAIARALVNDPDILLADEPTGALDSETSIQVMDLLKEVAKDRLVVMVTHNPELAEQYATRIVNLKDGHITGDSDPLIIDENLQEPPVHKNLGKASMSFLTALALSFNNLKTKLTRTILVAFAGSIGIIGIASILSLSTGVNKYIEDVQEETLLEYPLEIQNAGISLASFIEVPEKSDEEEEEKVQKSVTERRVASSIFSRVSSNDLASLKVYFESDECDIRNYAKAIEYSYNVTPLIYRLEGDQIYQINPDQSMGTLGFGGGTFFSSQFSANIFQPLPYDRSLYINSYDLKAGHWPTNNQEAVLVISQTGHVTDTVLYSLGLKDMSEMQDMLNKFAAGEDVEESKDPLLELDYEDFIGLTFKHVFASDKYVYDDEYDVWKNKSDDKVYMRDLIRKSNDLTITGVVMRKEDASTSVLIPGSVYYPYELTMDIMDYAAGSTIVRSQINDSGTDVFTGSPFNEDREDSSLNLETLFSVDVDALNRVFSFDASKLQMDTSAFSDMDMSDLDLSGMDMSALSDAVPAFNEEDFADLLSNINIKVNQEQLMEMFRSILEGYSKYAQSDTSTDYTKLPDAIRKYLEEDETREYLRSILSELITTKNIDQITEEQITELVAAVMSGYQEYVIANELDPQNFNENLAAYLQTEEASQLIREQTARIAAAFAEVEITDEEIQKIISDITENYEAYAEQNNLPEPEKIVKAFTDYLQTDEGKKTISEGIEKSVNTDEISKQFGEAMADMFTEFGENLASAIGKMMTDVISQLTEKITTAMTTAMQSLAENMNDAFSIHPEEFAKAISMNMDEQQLQELLSSLMSKEQASYEGNLRTLGYAEVRKPYAITIYPRNFESKEHITEILDNYNQRMKDTGQDEKVINYTDTVGLLMSSVTDIINAISYVLIAFVAISLVVSSIMIGVITYISVLERRKEIGILRAIGASKRNVSSVFNAETFIIGLLAGIFGIVITELLLIPGNALIRHFTDANVVAQLPYNAAVILVILSVILTMIGGLIPSRKAAKSDPVTALRTE